MLKFNFKITVAAFCLAGIVAIIAGCSKEPTAPPVISSFAGTYKNIAFSEKLLGEFSTGIYQQGQYPPEIETLQHGRIEIDFRYNGGALLSFSPLMYYGSINKTATDDGVEEPGFHLAIEIGHYNVVPFPLENLFYTLCKARRPLYCRDTNLPVNIGTDYTFVVDKRPEGIVLQLRQGSSVINVLPNAFFPDSTQLFFNDVSRYIDTNKGDSLVKVFMVGKGFTGFEKGIHDFNGTVDKLRLYKYTITESLTRYEIQKIRNQHTENQEITFAIKDNFETDDKSIIVRQQFWPYKFNGTKLIPNGSMRETELPAVLNSQTQKYLINNNELGFYKLYLRTIDKNGSTVATSAQPFEIWVYPQEWNFEFY